MTKRRTASEIRKYLSEDLESGLREYPALVGIEITVDMLRLLNAAVKLRIALLELITVVHFDRHNSSAMIKKRYTKLLNDTTWLDK